MANLDTFRKTALYSESETVAQVGLQRIHVGLLSFPPPVKLFVTF